MKNLQTIFFGFALLFTCLLNAQNTYTVNGESLSLKTEVEGTLTLLWNTIDGEYRYFSKKNSDILELKNTKENGDYKNEFRQILAQQTSDASIATDNVNLTLPSLLKFFNSYNTAKNPSFIKAATPLKPVLRLGGFAGITNSNFSENPNNNIQLQVGTELELADRSNLKRHAMVLRLSNTFATSDYDYNAFQTSLNYRFKFVMQPKFDIYVNTKFAAYTSVNGERILDVAGAPEPVIDDLSGSSFDFPFAFGLGADFPLCNGYLTLLLDDIMGLNVESNGEFPTNLLLGYKFEL